MKKLFRTNLKKLSGSIDAGLRMIQNLDYKVLSQTLFQIQASDNPEEALEHMTYGLKKILDYNLFAFFIRGTDRNTVMAWIEPEYYEKYMKKIFEEDSGMSTDNGLIYMTLKNRDEGFEKFAELDIESRETRIFRIALPHLEARIYLTPGRHVLPYHMEIINLLIESFKRTVTVLLEIEHLRQEASVDGLTGVSNRADFERQMAHYVSNAKRYGKTISMIMFDIDNFKKINDTYGHQTGDQILKLIADTVKTSIRSCDLIARYGGEEFAVILPETPPEMAFELADRLRIKIAEARINKDNRAIGTTASFGVACLKPAMKLEDFIKEADINLYEAKKRGKNMVVYDAIEEIA